MEKVKQRFNAFYKLEKAGKISSQIGQIKRKLKLSQKRLFPLWEGKKCNFLKRHYMTKKFAHD